MDDIFLISIILIQYNETPLIYKLYRGFDVY